MGVLMGRETMIAVCNLLGLGDQPIHRIVIDLQLDEVVHVYIDDFVNDIKVDELMEVLGKFNKAKVHGAAKKPDLDMPPKDDAATRALLENE